MLNFQNTINLTTSLNGTTIQNYGPLDLVIEPRFLVTSNKIRKIEYTFEDEKIIKNLFYTNEINPSLPIQTEKGDPRNYKVYKTLYIKNNSISQTYTISVNVYQIGLSDPINITFFLKLNAPKLDGLPSGFFDSVELVNTRMFGVDNDILYVFETKNPNYYIPVVVNWNNRDIPKPIVDFSSKTRRAYKRLEAYQNATAENAYGSDFIDMQKIADNDPNYPPC